MLGSVATARSFGLQQSRGTIHPVAPPADAPPGNAAAAAVGSAPAPPAPREVQLTRDASHTPPAVVSFVTEFEFVSVPAVLYISRCVPTVDLLLRRLTRWFDDVQRGLVQRLS